MVQSNLDSNAKLILVNGVETMPESIDNPLPTYKKAAVEADQPHALSEKKLKANRENAKKSTGPRTARGKANSRRNALKHGLFARHWSDFGVLGEDQREYEKLLNDFCDQYQPIGRAEELEVERITICWWRLKRAWRYENAESHIGVRDFARQEIDYQEEHLQKMQREADAVLLELRKARNAIELTGGSLPEDLKQRIFAIDQRFECILSGFARCAQEDLNAFIASKKMPALSPEEHSSTASLITLALAIRFFEAMDEVAGVGVIENATARHLVPNRDAGDRLLRYETATEKSLARAVDRLERLQRRRKGEPVSSSVSVRLTQ